MESFGSEINLVYFNNGEMRFEKINMSDRKSTVTRTVSNSLPF